MKYFVYILRTSANTLYTGQTQDLEGRILKHKNKTGAKYVSYFPSFELVYSETHATRSEAMRRESQLKSWPRAKKEALIKGS